MRDAKVDIAQLTLGKAKLPLRQLSDPLKSSAYPLSKYTF